jgi:hypothetical protein
MLCAVLVLAVAADRQQAAIEFMRSGAGITHAVSRCPFDALVGVGPRGARRFLCGVNRLLPGTPLFSFGSNGDFRFEDTVRLHVPSVPVVVFDPTLSNNRKHRAVQHCKENGYVFVPTGIGAKNGWLQMTTSTNRVLFRARVNTLPALLKQSGFATIGILKIDASGEFEVFARLQSHGFNLTTTVGILLLEIHMFHPQEDGSTANCCYGPEDFTALFVYLVQSGFMLVGYEVGECCGEFSFVNPSFPGFSH